MPFAPCLRPMSLAGLVLGLLAATAVPLAAQPVMRFDGRWGVDLSCSATEGGVVGYQWRFTADVRNGVLHGEHDTKGAPGWMTLDGPIKLDGSAVLVADGLTNDPRGTYRHVASGSAFHYHVNAQFNLANGAGTRVEQRPCTLVFTKQ